MQTVSARRASRHPGTDVRILRMAYVIAHSRTWQLIQLVVSTWSFQHYRLNSSAHTTSTVRQICLTNRLNRVTILLTPILLEIVKKIQQSNRAGMTCTSNSIRVLERSTPEILQYCAACTFLRRTPEIISTSLYAPQTGYFLCYQIIKSLNSRRGCEDNGNKHDRKLSASDRLGLLIPPIEIGALSG